MADIVFKAEVEQASEQFIAVVEKALAESGMDRNQAAGRVSYLVGLLWDRLEEKAMRLPRERPPVSRSKQAQDRV